MKSVLLFLIVFIPSLVDAQNYSIPKAELVAGLKKEGHKVDMTKDDWKGNAKIIFTGLAAGDFAKIEVKFKKNEVKKIDPEPDQNNGTAIFDASTIIGSEKEGAFNVYFGGGTPLGTVTFDVTTAGTTGSGDKKDNDLDSVFNSYIGALATANFTGNNKYLSNLTPIINFGGVFNLVKQKTGDKNRWVAWDLDVNPYLGAAIDLKDSVSFIPGLMLYGRGGISLNNYLSREIGPVKLTLMPFGFGWKVIPDFRDSANTIMQHNIRFGFALQYSNAFLLGGQLTQGWHNMTSESEANYKKIFGNTATDITYLTITGQFAMKGKNNDVTNYIFLEWRSLLSRDRYPAFTNNRIVTLGFRKTLEMSSGIFSAGSGGRSRNSHVVHGSL